MTKDSSKKKYSLVESDTKSLLGRTVFRIRAEVRNAGPCKTCGGTGKVEQTAIGVGDAS